jgi:ubiquinone/menaquinone biosynthesis C-methylase UbiE
VELLANALAGLGLLEKRESRFSNSPFADAHLVPGKAEYLGGYLDHHVAIWERWDRLSEAVRAGTLEAAQRPGGLIRALVMAMHTSSQMHAESVVDSVDLAGVRRIIDIGGGSGDYAYAFLRRLPEATAVVFDLPAALPTSLEYAGLAGMAERVELRPGDYFADEFGDGFGLAVVSNILHSLDWAGCVMVLAKAYRCLDPGGRVVVHDFVLTEDGTQPQWASLFSLNMLTVGSPGRSYTHVEIRRMLEEARFGDVEHVPMEGDSDLLMGTRLA